MEWSTSITFFMLLAVVGIPVYRLETLRYTDLYNECYESWEKDQELDGLHICAIPAMRERYRGRVDCDGAKKSTLVDPRDCAYRQWISTFWPVKTFFEIKESLEGTWYVYGLTALLLVIVVYTWINSRASVEKRRLELAAFERFGHQFMPQQGQSLMPYKEKIRSLPYQDGGREIVYVNRGSERIGGAVYD